MKMTSSKMATTTTILIDLASNEGEIVSCYQRASTNLKNLPEPDPDLRFFFCHKVISSKVRYNVCRGKSIRSKVQYVLYLTLTLVGVCMYAVHMYVGVVVSVPYVDYILHGTHVPTPLLLLRKTVNAQCDAAQQDDLTTQDFDFILQNFNTMMLQMRTLLPARSVYSRRIQ